MAISTVRPAQIRNLENNGRTIGIKQLNLQIRSSISRNVVHLAVMVRTLIEFALSCAGYLNFKPLFSKPRTGKKQIAFQAYSVHLAQFYKPIIAELTRSPNSVHVKFVILLHPHFPLRTVFELRRFARSELNLAEEDIVFRWQVMWDKFDLAVFADAYAKFPARKTKTCLLTHGPGLPKRFFTEHMLRKSVHDFDLVLVSGKYDHELVRRSAGPKPGRARTYAVGVPFLDTLKDERVARTSYFQRIGLDPGKQTILFAPHWKTLAAIRATGKDCFDELLSELKSSDVNILVKLHACSLNPAMSGRVNWRAKLDELSRDHRVRVDQDVSDVPALCHADVLITDTSSRAFNFMLLHKPVILYGPARHESDDFARARMTQMRRGAFVAESAAEVISVLRHLNLPRTCPMAVTVAKECFSNFGNATQITVDLLKQESGCRSYAFPNPYGSLGSLPC